MRTLMAMLPLLLGLDARAALITTIDFKVEKGESILEITSDAPITYSDQRNERDQQLVLDVSGAKLATNASRALDTSSFDSPVTLVSPYQVEGQQDQVRIVVQLNRASEPAISQEGNVIRVIYPPAAPPAPAEAVAGGPPAEGAPAAGPGFENADARLTEFEQARKSGVFKGSPITLQVREADIHDVLRMISEASGFNIVVGTDVRGKITLSLLDVPWDQALDVTLKTMQLGAERQNNILRVVTLRTLTQEKTDELAAKAAVEASAPRITRIFPVSYADLGELTAILQTFGGTGGSGAGSLDAATLSGSEAVIQPDNRTNSIVVRDTVEGVDRIKKLIEILDTQTPQVLIEAKIVEASETFNKSLNANIGFGGTGSNQFIASFNGANPTDLLVGGVFADGNDAASGANAGRLGISPTLAFFPGVQRLNALLNWGENEALVKIVSAPKAVVLNKQQATFTQSTPIGIPQTTFNGSVATITTTIVNADVTLDVTPTVTNDEGVILDLSLTRGVPFDIGGGQQAVANRNLDTNVLVQSGSTLVIGGIFTMDHTKSEGGFPVLRKIPILGIFFGQESDATSRSELFMFITPRILNVKEAGLT